MADPLVDAESLMPLAGDDGPLTNEDCGQGCGCTDPCGLRTDPLCTTGRFPGVMTLELTDAITVYTGAVFNFFSAGQIIPDDANFEIEVSLDVGARCVLLPVAEFWSGHLPGWVSLRTPAQKGNNDVVVKARCQLYCNLFVYVDPNDATRFLCDLQVNGFRLINPAILLEDGRCFAANSDATQIQVFRGVSVFAAGGDCSAAVLATLNNGVSPNPSDILPAPLYIGGNGGAIWAGNGGTFVVRPCARWAVTPNGEGCCNVYRFAYTGGIGFGTQDFPMPPPFGPQQLYWDYSMQMWRNDASRIDPGCNDGMVDQVTLIAPADPAKPNCPPLTGWRMIEGAPGFAPSGATVTTPGCGGCPAFFGTCNDPAVLNVSLGTGPATVSGAFINSWLVALNTDGDAYEGSDGGRDFRVTCESGHWKTIAWRDSDGDATTDDTIPRIEWHAPITGSCPFSTTWTQVRNDFDGAVLNMSLDPLLTPPPPPDDPWAFFRDEP